MFHLVKTKLHDKTMQPFDKNVLINQQFAISTIKYLLNIDYWGQ